MQTNNIFNCDVYLVQTDKGPRLFYGYAAAVNAAIKYNSIITCGGARWNSENLKKT